MEHVEAEDAAAAVVDVVRVAVVRRAEGHDRAEARRPPGGDLEGVEAAPGDAPHAELPVAPGLLGDPGEDLDGVVLLLLRVFVGDDAVAVPRAPHVHPDGRVAEAGEVGLALGVANGRSVGLAVREVLEDRRHRVVLGVLGQPDPRGEARPVGEVEPGVLDLADATRKVRPDRRH